MSSTSRPKGMSQGVSKFNLYYVEWACNILEAIDGTMWMIHTWLLWKQIRDKLTLSVTAAVVDVGYEYMNIDFANSDTNL